MKTLGDPPKIITKKFMKSIGIRFQLHEIEDKVDDRRANLYK